MRYELPKRSQPTLYDFQFLHRPSITSHPACLLEGDILAAVDGHVLSLVQNLSVVAHIVRERGRFGEMLSCCQPLLRAI